MEKLVGDPHNFGKIVKVQGNSVIKPRQIFLETMLLSQNRFRTYLDELFLKIGEFSPLALLPKVAAIGDNSSGSIDYIALNLPSRKVPEPENFFGLGNLIYTLSWLGVTDLHVENIAIGWDSSGEFRMAPLDVEEVLADLQSPMDTILIPSAYIPAKTCGIGNLLSHLYENRDRIHSTCLAAFCDGYLNAATVLNSNRTTIESEIVSIIMECSFRVMIRTFFRKTQSYKNFLNGNAKKREFEIPALPSELEQLGRGDIPYYFRYADSNQTFYFKEPNLIAEAEIGALKEEFKCLRSRIISSSGIDPATGETNLKKLGVAQMARTIDSLLPMDSYRSSFGETVVRAEAGRLFLESKKSVPLSFVSAGKFSTTSF
jgi:hypothetical protein